MIRSPFSQHEDTPIQPIYAAGQRGTVELEAPFREALADLEGFERIWLLYYCDRAKPFEPRIVPYRDTEPRGLFATRAPARPNPLGLSAVRLLGVDIARGVLDVDDLDVLDGSPLIDIKPYVPAFDAFEGRVGWLERGLDRRRADGRFEPED